ncbi:hypothetical protein KEM48_013873 [Puccinia striiformis f. sp. tritici PST-130]|nr:hypothetical protein KEM48_013873 [Puccinia striiformis f. sp. tritici PST-130]
MCHINPNPSFPSGSARAHHRSERPHYDEDTEESRCPSPLHSCPILSPHHLRPNDSISPTPVRKPEETGWDAWIWRKSSPHVGAVITTARAYPCEGRRLRERQMSDP